MNSSTLLVCDFGSCWVHRSLLLEPTWPETDLSTEPKLMRDSSHWGQRCSHKVNFTTEWTIISTVDDVIFDRHAHETNFRKFSGHTINQLFSHHFSIAKLKMWCPMAVKFQCVVFSCCTWDKKIWPRVSVDQSRSWIRQLNLFTSLHENPAKRGSWDPHEVDRWHIRPELESYRCYKVWIRSGSNLKP